MGVISQDVETTLYKILNASASLKSAISGSIYKEGFRPTNSGKEDIVINTLSLSTEQPQIAIVNINCHVQDLQQKINNVVQFVPNTIKLKSIADKVKDVIDEALTNPLYKDFSCRVSFQKTFKNQDTEVREHFQNLRIELIIPK